MPKTEPFDAAYWRGRAQEARKVAARLTDPTSQESMWSVAKTYDRMANSADMRESPKSQDPLSWAADIFEAETLRLMHIVSFPTYEELRCWLVALTSDRPNQTFRASFDIPADAPEGYREELEAFRLSRPAPT